MQAVCHAGRRVSCWELLILSRIPGLEWGARTMGSGEPQESRQARLRLGTPAIAGRKGRSPLAAACLGAAFFGDDLETLVGLLGQSGFGAGRQHRLAGLGGAIKLSQGLVGQTEIEVVAWIVGNM